MSDSVETAAVIDAPVVTETVTEAAPVYAESAAAARKSLHERAIGRVPAGPVRSVAAAVNDVPVPRPRDDAGRYAAVNEAPAPETTAAPDAPVETATTDAEAVPSEMARIQLPEDHPLRHRLGAEVEVPKQIEDLVRWANNNVVRQRHVEQTDRQLREAQREIALLKAQTGAWQEQARTAIASPEVTATYYELKEKLGDAEANRYLRGVEAEHADGVNAKTTEAMNQLSAQEAEQTEQAFVQNTYTNIRTHWPEWTTGAPSFNAVYDKACRLYGTYLMETQGSHLNDRVFVEEFLQPLVLADPEIKRRATAQYQTLEDQKQTRINAAAQKKAEADAAAHEREALDARQNRRSNNALGRLPSGAQPATLPTTMGPRNAQEAQQQRKARLRGAA